MKTHLYLGGVGRIALEQHRDHVATHVPAIVVVVVVSSAHGAVGWEVSALSAAQLAVVSNKGLIAVNQDPLGVQARKVRGFSVNLLRSRHI